MELKWESLVRRCSVEKLFLKIQKILRKIYVPQSRECGKDNSLWILRNFQEYLFCRTSVNAYLRKMKQWNNLLKNIFTENHRWWCPLKYSCRIEGLQHGCLQFYLKGTQSQILSRKTCVKFCRASVLHNTTYYWATASDFQQHFWRIAFFISNTLIKSKQIV